MRILRNAGAIGSGVRRLNLRGLPVAIAGGTGPEKWQGADNHDEPE